VHRFDCVLIDIYLVGTVYIQYQPNINIDVVFMLLQFGWVRWFVYVVNRTLHTPECALGLPESPGRALLSGLQSGEGCGWLVLRIPFHLKLMSVGAHFSILYFLYSTDLSAACGNIYG